MITFTRANEVKAGQVIRSTDYNSLARAVNDRILSGVADAAWRIIWSELAIVGQIRQQGKQPVEGAMVIPRFDEWLRFYGLLDSTGPEWPETKPGDPEGINLANPLGWFVYGSKPLYDESDRFSFLEPYQGGSLGDAWDKAKSQRGGLDPNTAVTRAPAVGVGLAHYSVTYPYISPFLKTYGGFLPTRQTIDDCGDGPSPTIMGSPVDQVIFTRIGTSKQIAFRGFCPAGTPGAALDDAIAGIGYGRDYYYLYKWGVDGKAALWGTLRTDEWLEGPYKGTGKLARGKGEHLDQTLNRFIMEFRGSEAERYHPTGWDVNDLGFDFQKFFKTQYYLAPAIGVSSESTDPETGDKITIVTTNYPQFIFQGATGFLKTDPVRSYAQKVGGGITHSIHDGFVLAGFYAQAKDLNGSVTLELTDDQEWKKEFTLTAAEPEFLIYFDQSEIRQRSNLRLHLKSDLSLKTIENGRVICELAELYNYKPAIADAYVLLRLASTRGGDSTGQSTTLDVYGKYVDNIAIQIWEDYAKYGCIVNTRATGLPFQYSDTKPSPISYNPVYEAARLTTIENARLAPRESLVGYEVVVEDIGGKPVEKSVLTYKRFYIFEKLRPADTFKSIAPPVEDTTSNGIVKTAPAQGVSNRWCCFINLNCYGEISDATVQSSNWKEESYDPMIRLNEPGHILSEDIEKDVDLRRHFSFDGKTYGPHQIVISESPSGYMYIKGTHKAGTLAEENQEAFYRSRQIYRPPYEIESATNVTVDGHACVRLKLTTRLQHYHELKGAVSGNIASWNVAAVQGEPYRTDENAIRQYLLHVVNKTQCPRIVGDVAPLTQDGLPPFGACFPRLYMVRLIPEVYADKPVENDTPQSALDTRILVDAFLTMERYGRAMCEGYVDEKSTVAIQDCTLDGKSFLIDYTAENWFMDAFGAPFIPVLPVSVRGDLQKGYSPLPRQICYAEIFNCYAKAFNKLTKARIEMPVKMEVRYREYIGSKPVSPDWPVGATCGGSSMRAVFSQLEAPTATTVISEPSGWSEIKIGQDTLQAQKNAAISNNCDGSGFKLETTELQVEFRFVPQEAKQVHAIPPALLDLMQSAGVAGFLGRTVNRSAVTTRESVSNSDDAEPCKIVSSVFDSHWFWVDGEGYKFNEKITDSEGACRIWTKGTLIAEGQVPVSDYYIGRTGGMSSSQTCRNTVFYSTILPVAGISTATMIDVPLA